MNEWYRTKEALKRRISSDIDNGWESYSAKGIIFRLIDKADVDVLSDLVLYLNAADYPD